ALRRLLRRLSAVHVLALSLSSTCFFFFLLPPLPSSTLFPYTTLFRSIVCVSLSLIDKAAFSASAHTFSACSHCCALVNCVLIARDRKSTRLNSSHDQISYAVFCLKKKNR